MVNDFQSILEKVHANGGNYWSRDDGNIYSPIGYSTLDTLFVIGETGLSTIENKVINEAVEFVLTYQVQDGAFKYTDNGSKHPCIAARIIAGLGRLGVKDDDRVEKSYQYFLRIQCNDGGWRCNTVKMGRSPLFDASNPGTTLYVLDAFRFRNNTIQEKEQLDKGVDFILQHWDVKIPVGPCQFGIGTRFMQIEYPFMRYNLFYYVYILSFYERAHNDRRFLEAYNCLASKVIDGKIKVEAPNKAWQHFGFAGKGKVSEPATTRWMEIQQNMK
jgi:hypothetical protein